MGLGWADPSPERLRAFRPPSSGQQFLRRVDAALHAQGGPAARYWTSAILSGSSATRWTAASVPVADLSSAPTRELAPLMWTPGARAPTDLSGTGRRRDASESAPTRLPILRSLAIVVLLPGHRLVSTMIT